MTPKALCRMVTQRTGATYALISEDDRQNCLCLNWFFDGVRTVGFNCTAEFLELLPDDMVENIADAVAVHVRRELQKPEGAELARGFIFNPDGHYDFPANNGEDFDFFRD